MAIFKNEKDQAVKVQFKVVGKAYSIGGDEIVDTAERTTYPFEEVVVGAGTQVELGNVEVIGAVELSVVSEAATKSLEAFMAGGEVKSAGVAGSGANTVSEATNKSLEAFQAAGTQTS